MKRFPRLSRLRKPTGAPLCLRSRQAIGITGDGQTAEDQRLAVGGYAEAGHHPGPGHHGPGAGLYGAGLPPTCEKKCRPDQAILSLSKDEGLAEGEDGVKRETWSVKPESLAEAGLFLM